MKLGILYANVGPFAEPDPFGDLIRAAEESGVESIWNVEHVVVPVDFESRYPYTADGQLPLPADTPLTDPLLSLSFAAAISESLRLATGVLLVAQRHPAYVAKALATLDRLSAGRAVLGVGVGWLREEADVLGIPFSERAGRTEESIRAIRSLWNPDPEPFEGEFFRWDPVESNPKPVQPHGVPVVVGGCVEASARRAARLGDGFFPVDGEPERLAFLIAALRDECAKIGRDPREIEISTVPVALDSGALRAYEEVGVGRLIVAPPAFDREGLRRGLGEIAETLRARS